MSEARKFVPGRVLSRGFFRDAAQPILDREFPDLVYTAGLLGYGSDVIGFDDKVSTDHMWGPRFYLFLKEEDMRLRERLMEAFSRGLPKAYRCWPVNFSLPDAPGGMRAMRSTDEERVYPLIWIESAEGYLMREIGVEDVSQMTAARWLSVAEHRLLSIASADLYADGLDFMRQVRALSAYPREVRLYRIASQWSILASEQAFSRRCSLRGDELGSRIIAARMAERLMRLCFLYAGVYAPYSKWFSAAFARLPSSKEMAARLREALAASDGAARERALIDAQCLAAEAHNRSGLTPPVAYQVQPYYDREMLVIHAERFAEAARAELRGTELEDVPLFGSVSDIGGLCEAADNPRAVERIIPLYRAMAETLPEAER